MQFMLVFGPLSSVFDFVTFGLLLFVFHADESKRCSDHIFRTLSRAGMMWSHEKRSFQL